MNCGSFARTHSRHRPDRRHHIMLFLEYDDVGELRMRVVGPQGASRDRVVKVSHHDVLGEHVGDNPRRAQQRRLELAFVVAVGADAGDEGAGSDIVAAEEGRARGRASDDHVAREGRSAQARRGRDVEPVTLRHLHGAAMRTRSVEIEHMDLAKRQDVQ